LVYELPEDLSMAEAFLKNFTSINMAPLDILCKRQFTNAVFQNIVQQLTGFLDADNP